MDLCVRFLVLPKVFFGLILTFHVHCNNFWSVFLSAYRRYSSLLLQSTRNFLCVQLIPYNINHNLHIDSSERDNKAPKILIVPACLGLKSNNFFLHGSELHRKQQRGNTQQCEQTAFDSMFLIRDVILSWYESPLMQTVLRHFKQAEQQDWILHRSLYGRNFT